MAGIPSSNVPIANEDRTLNYPWLQLFQQIWKLTGGSTVGLNEGAYLKIAGDGAWDVYDVSSGSKIGTIENIGPLGSGCIWIGDSKSKAVSVKVSGDGILDSSGKLVIFSTRGAIFGRFATAQQISINDLTDGGDITTQAKAAALAMIVNSSDGWGSNGEVRNINSGNGSSGGTPVPTGPTCVDLYNPPKAADFTTILNGDNIVPAPTVTDTDNLGMVLHAGVSGSLSRPVRGALKLAPSGSSWAVECRLLFNGLPYPDRGFALTVSNGTTHNAFWIRGADSGMWMGASIGTTVNWAAGGVPLSAANRVLFGSYFRVVYNGAYTVFYLSSDGRNWSQVTTSTLLPAPDLSVSRYVGVLVNPYAYTGAPAGQDNLSVSIPYWAETTSV